MPRPVVPADLVNGQQAWDAFLNAWKNQILNAPFPPKEYADFASLPAPNANQGCLAWTLAENVLWISDNVRWNRLPHFSRQGNPRHIDNVRMNYFNATLITVLSPLQVYDSTGDHMLHIEAGGLTYNTANLGELGIDVGAVAPNTWYAVHLMGQSSDLRVTSGVLSLSPTAPTLPIPWDRFKRIGWIRTDGASQIIPFYQEGTEKRRRIHYTSPEAGRQVLVGGAAVAPTTVSLAALVPSTARLAKVHAHQGGAPVLNLIDTASGNIVGTVQPGNETHRDMVTDATQQISYSNAAGGGVAHLFVDSYVDEL